MAYTRGKDIPATPPTVYISLYTTFQLMSQIFYKILKEYHKYANIRFIKN